MKPFVLAALLLTSVCHAEELGKDWEQATPHPDFGERRGMAAVVHDDQLWVIGGYGAGLWYNDAWYSTDGEEWQAAAKDAPWPARSDFAAADLDGRLYVLGGYNGTLLHDVWTSADGIEWKETADAAPWSARSHFAAAVLNGRLYVLGGQEESARLNDVWSSADGADWKQETASAPWPPRSHFAAAVLNDRLYILGGARFDFDTDNYVYDNDVWSTADGATWNCVTEAAPWTPRHLHQVVALRGRLWLIGGDDDPMSSSHLMDVWSSPDGAAWTQVTNRARWERRNFFSCAAWHDSIYLIGGMRYSGGIFDYKDSVWVSGGNGE